MTSAAEASAHITATIGSASRFICI